MTSEEYEKWIQAGKIAAEALEYGRTLIKNGAIMRDVCEKIDQKIIDLGAKPAWPSQISMDSVAAHYTPDHDDESAFDGQVVSLDVGAQVDGYVGDNALTVDLSGKYDYILKAAQEALNAGISKVKTGATLGEIGKAIQDAITARDLVSIKNLSGHGISRFVIHDKPSVPNYATNDSRQLKEGQVIAIEPFASNGIGMIYETDQANIFNLRRRKPIRSPFAREILNFIEQEYGPFPFATRWLAANFGAGKTNLAIRELLKHDILDAHPPLAEQNKDAKVAVFEKTMIVRNDGAEITTK
ncbi:type II methionyl aminopeptidase [Candidatus Woesearchaeota archaeon CG10_big_fil_rev_8_21_14_0_10_37_12]|nr:MAG: type II methionyl aminopeptidase [Candidatus Woesearchaeota archaeon CG10_big_fil_rev_8_21_14_0_10_37_12]